MMSATDGDANAGEARIDAATLTHSVERLFVAAGCDSRVAHLVADGLVFAPGKLCGRDEFARLTAWLRASPPAPSGGGIHLPGEPERLAARERERQGIPLPRRTREALQACAVHFRVAYVDFVASCAPGGRG